MSQWQPMETLPTKGNVHVTGPDGSGRMWRVYGVSVASVPYLSQKAEFWMPVEPDPPPPLKPMRELVEYEIRTTETVERVYRIQSLIVEDAIRVVLTQCPPPASEARVSLTDLRAKEIAKEIA